MEKFVCICGKEFGSIKALSGHKASCKEYYMQRDGNLDGYFYYIKRHSKSDKEVEKEKEQIEKWISEQHTCERCGKVMTEYYGSGRFCSRYCSNKRQHSNETKEKISRSLQNSVINVQYKKNISNRNRELYHRNPKTCVICGGIIPYEKRNRKTCCEDCYAIYDREIQKRFSPVQRSKNEIDFCNMCIDFFGSDNVVNNEKMFNGWDADVILPQYKIAVLWNGPWHYEKITKNQKFEQIKNRDRIKLCEIQKCGYMPYIIKDMGQADYAKVVKEFGMFLDWIIETHTV